MNEQAIVADDTPQDDFLVEDQVEDQAEQAEVEQPEAPEQQVEAEKSEKPEKPEITPEVQEYINNHIIPSRLKKQQELDEENRRLKQEREELQQRLGKFEETTRPDIPPLPDPYDDDYEEKVKVRDQKIQEAAVWDREQEMLQQQQMQQQVQEFQQRQHTLMQKGETYDKRARDLGITPTELASAGAMVQQFGINDIVADHILEDERGPELTVYLANNPAELEQVANMTPGRAAIYLETQVKPKAQRKAPEPPPAPREEVGGKGFPESDNPEGYLYD